MKKKKIIIASSIIGFILVVLLPMPIFSVSTNCGGNNAALAYTISVALDVRMALEEWPNLFSGFKYNSIFTNRHSQRFVPVFGRAIVPNGRLS
ncbi:MAG: hypothetical protein JW808_04135 [Victivallales bacterium]|nr:hypothetical protein [Victivallales bacterium]